jgi:hypothetical protein
MAVAYKVLGQAFLTNTFGSNVYTVPAATSSVISTINLCNQASVPSTFSIAIRPAGAALANQHYIALNTPIPALDAIALTLGITLGNTDVVQVFSGYGNTISVSLFGAETS